MFIFWTSPINLNCTHFSENNCICDSVHQHVKDEKYSHCNQFGKLLQDPYKYALYKTSETIEISNKYTCNNYRDVPVDSSNPDRHESMNTEEESCKSKDYEKWLYLHYNITQNQTLYREKKAQTGRIWWLFCFCILSFATTNLYWRDWCGKCRRWFCIDSNLTVYHRIHTGKQPYKYNICDKFFTQCSGLKTHQRIHAGEKTYGCKKCRNSFIEKSSFDRHLFFFSLYNIHLYVAGFLKIL